MNQDEIVVTRIFDARRELVWRAWTNAEHLKKWWAPQGCTTPYCSVDLRIGGKFLYCMQMADGKQIWGRGVYQEIVELEKLVFLDSFADADGNAVPPSHYGMSESHPTEAAVSVRFTDQSGKTVVTLKHSIPVSVKERDQMITGWSEMLDRLTQHITGE